MNSARMSGGSRSNFSTPKTSGGQRGNFSDHRKLAAVHVAISRHRTLAADRVVISRLRKLAAVPVAISRHRKSAADPVAISRLRKSAADPVAISRLRKSAADRVAISRHRKSAADRAVISRLRKSTADRVVISRRRKPAADTRSNFSAPQFSGGSRAIPETRRTRAVQPSRRRQKFSGTIATAGFVLPHTETHSAIRDRCKRAIRPSGDRITATSIRRSIPDISRPESKPSGESASVASQIELVAFGRELESWVSVGMATIALLPELLGIPFVSAVFGIPMVVDRAVLRLE